jgi:hypothetical protein
VGVGVAVAVGAGVAVAVGAAVAVAVGAGVAVAVGAGVAVAVGAGVGVAVGAGVGVAVGAGVAVGVGSGVAATTDTATDASGPSAVVEAAVVWFDAGFAPFAAAWALSTWSPGSVDAGIVIVAASVDWDVVRTRGIPAVDPSHWSWIHVRAGNPVPLTATLDPATAEPPTVSAGPTRPALTVMNAVRSAGRSRTTGRVASH